MWALPRVGLPASSSLTHRVYAAAVPTFFSEQMQMGTWAMEQQAPWDEIVRAWHDVAVPVAQTAAQYGMSASALMAATI